MLEKELQDYNTPYTVVGISSGRGYKVEPLSYDLFLRIMQSSLEQGEVKGSDFFTAFDFLTPTGEKDIIKAYGEDWEDELALKDVYNFIMEDPKRRITAFILYDTEREMSIKAYSEASSILTETKEQRRVRRTKELNSIIESLDKTYDVTRRVRGRSKNTHVIQDEEES
jgi:hypothetical protein